MARPTTYTEETAARICEEIAAGRSVASICKDEDMPAASTVFLWLAKNPEFSERYTRAREAQADALFDEALNIADTPADGVKIKVLPSGSVEKTYGDMIEHRRLQVDTRKWAAARLAPKKYGDRLDMNVTGSLQTVSDENLDARIAQLLGKAGSAGPAGGAGAPEGEE